MKYTPSNSIGSIHCGESHEIFKDLRAAPASTTRSGASASAASAAYFETLLGAAGGTVKSADPGCVIYAALGAWSKSVENGKRNGGSSGKLIIPMEIHPMYWKNQL